MPCAGGRTTWSRPGRRRSGAEYCAGIDSITDTGEGLEAWVADTWSRSLSLRDWWRALADARLAFPQWPEANGGRGWDRALLRRRNASLRDAGAIGPPTGLGVLMGAPIVIQYGTPDQQSRWLPELASGREAWCQLFSEPGAGSDLAAVRTSAVRDGAEWVVDGQKVWTSGAAQSDRGMLVARTNPDVPKHRGLSYFILDMDQPGVDVRPLHQMNGAAHFSEVFLDAARVDERDLVDVENGGWAVTVATLGYERAGLGDAGAGGVRPPAGERAGWLDRECGDVIDELSANRAEAADAPGAAHRLAALASTLDAPQRDRLVDVAARQRMAEWSARRAKGDAAAASTAKLAWTERLKVARDLALELQGPDGMLVGTDAPDGGEAATFALSVPSASIAGGTDEVQRNIISERILGLPKDVQTDRDTPFRDVPGGGTAV